MENTETNKPLQQFNDSIKTKDAKPSTEEDTSCDKVNNNDSDEPQCVPEEDIESLMPAVYSSKNIDNAKDMMKGVECLDSRNSTDDEETLPSRENLSPDPEIATLQTTLFSAIDMALQTYSDDVLELREKRSIEQHTIMNI